MLARHLEAKTVTRAACNSGSTSRGLATVTGTVLLFLATLTGCSLTNASDMPKPVVNGLASSPAPLGDVHVQTSPGLPWDNATLSRDGRTITVSFNGLCGGRYRGGTHVTSTNVAVSVYGTRPVGDVCGGPKTVTIHLRNPLGNRTVVDAYDGHSHPLSNTAP